RTVLRIEEARDEAGLAFLLRLLGAARQQILHGLDDCAFERQALDPLSAPVGADLAAPYAPHFLGVVAEKGLVQPATIPVDEEGVEVGLVAARQQLRLAVAQRDE